MDWAKVEIGYVGDDFINDVTTIKFSLSNVRIYAKCRDVSGGLYDHGLKNRLMFFKAQKRAEIDYSIAINEYKNRALPGQIIVSTFYINY